VAEFACSVGPLEPQSWANELSEPVSRVVVAAKPRSGLMRPAPLAHRLAILALGTPGTARGLVLRLNALAGGALALVVVHVPLAAGSGTTACYGPTFSHLMSSGQP
jgi:hypothetical protein